MKKIPQRTCIGCNSKKDKKDLIRVVKNKDGQISIDLTVNKAIKNKRISRTFEMEIDESIYENLRNFINGGEIIG